MDLSHIDIVDIVFQLIAFLFAISVHESAHAWTANQCGDPTARMLGRITLNPIKHIDPVGTILMPLIAMVTGFPVIGWAKPTPVDPRNFKNPVGDDILTSVAGPVSNFLVASLAVVVMLIIAVTSAEGRNLVQGMATNHDRSITEMGSSSFLVPATLFLYELMLINIVLAVFNLIPVPPLDGSHVLRHFLPDPIRRAYDTMGIFGLLALVYFGGRLLSHLIAPPLHFFDWILTRL
jgi:Zn-dependent protease